MNGPTTFTSWEEQTADYFPVSVRVSQLKDMVALQTFSRKVEVGRVNEDLSFELLLN
jgi:hypothetical protein